MTLATKTAPKNFNNDLNNMFRHVRIEHLVAGMSGGVTSALCLHPLDIIKIRFATNTGRSKYTPQYAGIWDATRTIYTSEGFFGLYRGVVPNVWGAGLSWGMYFLLYTTLKTRVQEGNVNAPLTPSQHLIAASEAGAMTLLFTNPFWVVKTRLCLQYGGSCPQQYTGMIDALVKIFRQDGIRGYYKGLVPGLFGASHGAVQFTVYEELKNQYNKYHNVPITTQLKNYEYLTFAALSKIIAVGVTYPYQVVRARLQSQYSTYKGIWDCVSQTWKYEGWRGFYKGLGPNIIRVTPATMITFITYENVSHFLIAYREGKQ